MTDLRDFIAAGHLAERGITLQPPRPIVNRCHNGCGQRISNNRILCLACRTKLQAEAIAKEQEHGQAEGG